MDITNKKDIKEESQNQDRRNFIKSAGIGILGVAAAGSVISSCKNKMEINVKRPLNERIKQISSNSYAVNRLFRRGRQSTNQETIDLKNKYGELTLLDFPGFTNDTYPGIETMDLWSSLFGDVEDESQFSKRIYNGKTYKGDFDPSLDSSKKYLDKLTDIIVKTGIKATHISNNAPRNIADDDEDARKEGIRVARNWLDASKHIGVKSMRVNTGGPRIIPPSVIKGGYPRDEEIVPYLKRSIDSFSEMAEYGEKVGVKVTIENHWGLAAHPMNIRIIIKVVNSEWCEASPDFCNWEHEYMLYHGLEALVPYASSMIHAKRWSRYPDVDISRCVDILNKARYKGYISLEYEAGGDPVEGTLKLMEDVLDALY